MVAQHDDPIGFWTSKDQIQGKARVPYSHPAFLAELYLRIPFALGSVDYDLPLRSLAKLLMYGALLREQSRVEGRDPLLIVQEEAKKYPYQMKEDLKVMFRPR